MLVIGMVVQNNMNNGAVAEEEKRLGKYVVRQRAAGCSNVSCGVPTGGVGG